MLKCRADRDELGDAFTSLLGVVPTTQPLKPILVNFHLASRDGHLLVEATDLDIGARIQIEHVEVMEDGELALPAQRIASLVREIPEKEVVIEARPDQHGAVIEASGYDFKLLGEDPSEFPVMAGFDTKEAVSVPRDRFLETLRRVAVATSRDPARYQLTGVYVEVEPEKLVMTATDGKRLTNDYFRLENPAKVEARGIVSNRAVDMLFKVLPQGDTEFQLAIGEANLQIAFGNGELTAKLIQGAYPDYKVAISQKIAIRVTAKRNDFLTAAKTAALMTDKETATVIFRFEEGKATLVTQALSIGESRIEVPIALQGEPIEIRFNPTYFIDALRCINEDEIRFEFLDSGKPGILRGGQHYRHMLMPLVLAT